jgi:hypothetical protein
MRQPTNKGKYIAAAAITAIIFLLGLFVGLTVDSKRVNLIQDQYLAQRLEFESSQLQYGYISTITSKDSCPAMYQLFYDNLKKMDEVRIKLETYALQSKINDNSFELLKREYTIEQIRYWMLSQQAQQSCNQDVVRVLYFYSTDKECPDCSEQAFVLDYVKKLFKDKVLIYALDGNLVQEPMIVALKKQFGVSSYPGIVIETEQSSNEFVSKDRILDGICSRFKERPKECPALIVPESEQENSTEDVTA